MKAKNEYNMYGYAKRFRVEHGSAEAMEVTSKQGSTQVHKPRELSRTAKNKKAKKNVGNPKP